MVKNRGFSYLWRTFLHDSREKIPFQKLCLFFPLDIELNFKMNIYDIKSFARNSSSISNTIDKNIVQTDWL